MERSCKNCAYLETPMFYEHCRRCHHHSNWQWKYFKAVVLVFMLSVGVLTSVGVILVSQDVLGDTLGVPVEVPVPDDGGCDD